MYRILGTHTFLKGNHKKKRTQFNSLEHFILLILCFITRLLLSTGRYPICKATYLSAESVCRVCGTIIQSLLFSHNSLICLYGLRLVGLEASWLKWLPTASFLSLSSSSPLTSFSNPGVGRLARIQSPQLWDSTYDT